MRALAVWCHGRFLPFICPLSDAVMVFAILVSISGFVSSYEFCKEFLDQFQISVLVTYCVCPFSLITQ